MKGFRPLLTGELAQWALGLLATATLIMAAETGEWKEAAYGLGGLLYASLVAWRAAEVGSGNGPGRPK